MERKLGFPFSVTLEHSVYHGQLTNTRTDQSSLPWRSLNEISLGVRVTTPFDLYP